MATKNTSLLKKTIDHCIGVVIGGAIVGLIPLGVMGFTVLFHLTTFATIEPFLAIMGVVFGAVIGISTFQILGALLGFQLYFDGEQA